MCRQGDAAGAYEATAVLGNGSFGSVYLAQDLRQPGRQVALKAVSLRPLAGGAEGPSPWAEAAAEAELLQRLDHPHVLRCHEAFEAGGAVRKLWIVLDYMDGGDLNGFYLARRSGGRAPPEATFVRRIMSAVGSALDYIHGMGLLHRDVKCANVLLSSDLDGIVLADFGLACSIKEAEDAAAQDQHTPVGTPTYIAPEVVCGRPHTPASDAWSLGVCSFKVAALRRPFEARDELELTMKIIKSEPRELPRCCPADVVCAVFGFLMKDGQKRLRVKDALWLIQHAPISRLACMGSKPPRRRLSCL